MSTGEKVAIGFFGVLAVFAITVPAILYLVRLWCIYEILKALLHI